ncbi:MAG: hypothetical protein IPJ20_08535 [Flammeovirgaceae bacterium]|nr:hypothetical protein [Flammeovirgaceae bacterium]
MKQFALTTATIFYLLNSAYGQNKTYIGLEFSIANDIYKITDNSDYLMNIPLINGAGGFNIRQEVNKNFLIEVGLLMKYYQQGFGFKTIPYYGSSSSDPSWLIPVRIGLNLNLYKGKIYLVPVVGFTFGINPPYGFGLGYGKQISSTTTIDYNYAENPDVTRYFSLLQTGIGFEVKLFKALLFSISTNYYKGFNKTTHLDINYMVNNSNQATGTAISKGDFWCVSTGLKYPISNFWTMHKGL